MKNDRIPTGHPDQPKLPPARSQVGEGWSSLIEFTAPDRIRWTLDLRGRGGKLHVTEGTRQEIARLGAGLMRIGASDA